MAVRILHSANESLIIMPNDPSGRWYVVFWARSTSLPFWNIFVYLTPEMKYSFFKIIFYFFTNLKIGENTRRISLPVGLEPTSPLVQKLEMTFRIDSQQTTRDKVESKFANETQRLFFCLVFPSLESPFPQEVLMNKISPRTRFSPNWWKFSRFSLSLPLTHSLPYLRLTQILTKV